MDTQQTYNYLISQGTQYKAAAEKLASDLTSINLDESDYVGISIENGTSFEGAFAIGVFLTGISNIDYLNGKYDASMRLYVFNITNPVCECLSVLHAFGLFVCNHLETHVQRISVNAMTP